MHGAERHPFNKIQDAGTRSDERKLEAARQSGVLNPRGQGGPVYEQMKEAFDNIGTENDEFQQARSNFEQTARARELFEAKLRRTGKRIYDEQLVGMQGAPTFDKFSADVEKSFQYGFGLYLKTMMRMDEADGPDQHEPYYAMVSGRGKRRVVDELEGEYYLRQYIAKGAEVPESVKGSEEGLARTDEDHNFNRDEAMEGYATKYQNTVESDGDVLETDESATIQGGLEAYMFEKLRLYSDEYFSMLKESLERGVKIKDAIDMSTYVYGNDSGIYEEMEEAGLDAQFVANQSIVNRARVRIPFEKYVAVGERLNEQYPYEAGDGGWVTSPQLIRNLIFKYPQTVEAGLNVVEVELSRLKETYPEMPQYLLVELCVESPDSYESRIRETLERAHDIMKEYPVGKYYDDDSDADMFKHFAVEGELVRMLDRVSAKDPHAHIDRALDAFQETVKLASDSDVDVSYGMQRRMLKSLLAYNASPAKVFKREERITARRRAAQEKLYEQAEKTDPVYGSYQVELGYGDTDEDILETGALQTEMVVSQYGPVDGERHLEQLTDLLYEYMEVFPDDTELQNALKDCLVMNPYDPSEAFTKLYADLEWPAEVEVIEFKG